MASKTVITPIRVRVGLRVRLRFEVGVKITIKKAKKKKKKLEAAKPEQAEILTVFEGPLPRHRGMGGHKPTIV